MPEISVIETGSSDPISFIREKNISYYGKNIKLLGVIHMLNMILFAVIFSVCQAITVVLLMNYFSSERFMAKVQKKTIALMKKLEDEFEDLV